MKAKEWEAAAEKLRKWFADKAAEHEAGYFSATTDSARGRELGKCDAFSLAAAKVSELI